MDNQKSYPNPVQATYKQALRGLFTAGTSVTRHSISEGGHLNQMTNFNAITGSPLLKIRRLKEKVGGKQRIEFRNVSGMSLQPAGQKPQNDERNYW